jgi:hypothetical protein
MDMGIGKKVAVTLTVSLAASLLVGPLVVGAGLGLVFGKSCASFVTSEIAIEKGSAAQQYLDQFSAVEQIEKQKIAILIVQIGLERQFSTHSIEIAVATAIQESNLTNYGNQGSSNDHDSLGIYQQRPSQNWGSAEEIMDPVHAINTFYDRLQTIPDRDSRSLIDIAIQIQIPNKDAYQSRWAWDEIAQQLVTGIANKNAVSACQNAGWQLPLDAGYTVSDVFGPRIHPVSGLLSFHYGYDLATSLGSPIYAAHSGEIVQIGWNGGYGNYIRIDNGDGTATAYGHISVFTSVLHQQVTAGEMIAKVGNTGDSTGPHLHFEVLVNGKQIDPEVYLQAVGIELDPSR